MKYIFSLFVTLFCTMAVCGQSEDLLQEANTAYETENFTKAEELYLTLAKDYSSFELFYNLGNASFKLNKTAQAILYYEKAKKISPLDEDLKTNLKIANELVTDQIESLPTLGVADFISNISSPKKLSKFSWYSIFFVILGCGAIAVLIFKKTFAYRNLVAGFAVLCGIGAISTFLLARTSMKQLLSNTEAIVYQQEVDVKGAPSETGTLVFKLHEGTKVQLVEENSEYYKIKIANGSVGWVPLNSVEPI